MGKKGSCSSILYIGLFSLSLDDRTKGVKDRTRAISVGLYHPEQEAEWNKKMCKVPTWEMLPQLCLGTAETVKPLTLDDVGKQSTASED